MQLMYESKPGRQRPGFLLPGNYSRFEFDTMEKTVVEKVIDSNSIYSQWFLESKSLYMYSFNVIPCITYIDDVEGKKASMAFKEKFSEQVLSAYEYKEQERKGKQRFIQCIMVLKNECIIEFNKGYTKILFKLDKEAFANEAIQFVSRFRERQRRKPLEINLVVRESNYIDLRAMEIKRTRLELDLFYEDDFKEVDEVIRRRLNTKNDKGIVLLHGLPGTGKTTYLRYLIGKLKKRVLFLSNSLAGSLLDPEFIDLLISNPNSVVIVEDAENIMMDRRTNGNSSVSSLLNISDGLLADFLNIQLVCTFNSPLVMVDPALMRKGRLIARYEFGKLSVEKAQRLSDHLKLDTTITRPMTVAEIANPHEKEEPRVQVIGFKRSNEIMN
jgi:GTPase SAR1 family protein